MIDKKIDFMKRGVDSVREQEQFLPASPMKLGKFTDLGLRFRKNIVDK